MKKLFSVLLSLFMLWGGVLISCSADADSSGGSAPEALKLIICDSQGEAKESTDLTYNKAEGTGSSFYVKSNYEDLSAYKITGISLVRTSDDNDTDITSKVNIEERSRLNGYKIDFSSAVSNVGNYQIIVYAQKGSEKEVKIILNLTVVAGSVNPEEKPTPEITKQPESVQWKAGEEAKTLTVEATISSGTISYQWFKDGNEIPNATATSYTPIEGGKYYVVVSNASDGTKSVRSSEVSVTIVAEEDLLPPVITANLAESASYDKVSDIKALSIKATATDGAEIYYKWYKDGNAIGEASTTASTYKPADFGSYYCELYASKGEKISQTINSKTIKISENPIIPKASVSPTSGYIGTELTVSVTYNVAEADVTYQWVRTDKNSGNDAPIAGETSNKYTPTVAGRYYCKCIVTSKNDPTNSKPVSSDVVEVSEEVGPEIPNIESINGKTASFTEPVKEGGTLELTVAASVSDGGTLSYTWYESKSASPIGTGPTYSKSGVTSSDAGEYYVTVKNTLNGKDVSTESFRVTVKMDTVEPDPEPVVPVINNINEETSDFDLPVKEGGSFTLTVSASTTDSGKLTYEWFKQGDTTSLGTGTSYSKSNVTSSDAGKYYVKVTNTLNGKTASTDSLKVTVTITSSEIGSGNGQFDFTSK